MFNKNEVESFVKVYMQPRAGIKLEAGHDFHQEFADELGICRQEAKALFHEMNYSLDFNNSMKRNG